MTCEQLQDITTRELDVSLHMADVALFDQEVAVRHHTPIVLDEELAVHLAGHQEKVARLGRQHPTNTSGEAVLDSLPCGGSVLTEQMRVVVAVVRVVVAHQVHCGETLVPLLAVAAPQVGTTQSSHSN